MSLTSLADAEWTAIVTRFKAAAPQSASLWDFSQIGGPVFDRPKLTGLSTLASADRLTTLQGKVWITLSILGTAGSGRPQGISPTSQTHREGMTVQSVHFPLGHGFDFVMPVVDDCREVFHRQSLSLSGGYVHFRDADPPVRADRPEHAASGWGFFNVFTPYWVREAN